MTHMMPIHPRRKVVVRPINRTHTTTSSFLSGANHQITHHSRTTSRTTSQAVMHWGSIGADGGTPPLPAPAPTRWPARTLVAGRVGRAILRKLLRN